MTQWDWQDQTFRPNVTDRNCIMYGDHAAAAVNSVVFGRLDGDWQDMVEINLCIYDG